MKSYNEALQRLHYPIKKDSKKLENNTFLIRKDDGSIGVKLHDTFIVVYYPKYCQLFTGGWYTSTTKDRINKYSPVYLTQSNHLWYIGSALFYNGIKIDNAGKIIGKIKDAKKILAKNKKIKASIKQYIDLAIEKLKDGIDLPSGGDCWYCCFKDESGKTWGNISSTDHLIHHIKDKYIVPSLVFNAVKEAGYHSPEFIIGYIETEKKMGGQYCSFSSVRDAIRKYMIKRLIER